MQLNPKFNCKLKQQTCQHAKLNLKKTRLLENSLKVGVMDGGRRPSLFSRYDRAKADSAAK